MDLFNINLNLYRSFYFVAKYGGFTKASKYAMLSQSSLSSNIKNLEDTLNVKLFERGVSSVSLTKEGKRLFSKLNEIVDTVLDKEEKNEINIGVLRFIADNYLVDALKKFKNNFKDIKVNLDFSYNTELYQKLKKNELDILICRYPLFYKFENYIRVEKIKDVQNVFACSKEFYEEHMMNIDLDNYIYPLILPDNSEKRRTIEQYLIDNNIRYKVSFELPNSNLLKKLIISGVGIGYINKKAISKEVRNGEIIILKNFKNIPLDNISIIYNANNLDKATKEFIACLKSTI